MAILNEIETKLMAQTNIIREMMGEKPLTEEEYATTNNLINVSEETAVQTQTPETQKDPVDEPVIEKNTNDCGRKELFLAEIKSRKRLGQDKSAIAQALVSVRPGSFESSDDAVKEAGNILRRIKSHGIDAIATDRSYEREIFRSFNDIELLNAYGVIMKALNEYAKPGQSKYMAVRYVEAVLQDRGLMAAPESKPGKENFADQFMDIDPNEAVECVKNTETNAEEQIYNPENPASKQAQQKEKPVLETKQGEWILRQLALKGTCYVPTRLQGELACYNGKTITVKTSKLYGIVARSIRRRANNMKLKVADEQITKVLDELCKMKYLSCIHVEHANNKYGERFCWYFVAMRKIQDRLRSSK